MKLGKDDYVEHRARVAQQQPDVFVPVIHLAHRGGRVGKIASAVVAIGKLKHSHVNSKATDDSRHNQLLEAFHSIERKFLVLIIVRLYLLACLKSPVLTLWS